MASAISVTSIASNGRSPGNNLKNQCAKKVSYEGISHRFQCCGNSSFNLTPPSPKPSNFRLWEMYDSSLVQLAHQVKVHQLCVTVATANETKSLFLTFPPLFPSPFLIGP